MSDVVLQTVMATWAARNLPARLDVAETAKLLGFAVHDIQILMAVGKLTPLGDPAPNAPKWFSAVEIIRLAGDQDWLDKATRELSKFWHAKRLRRQSCPPSSRPIKREPTRFPTEKVSPNSSPESSPDEQNRSNDGAIKGGCRAAANSA
ncbi:MAG TPA: hypothetical protein VGY98_04785 [Verrucomicrobiae bacterium]|nr:hypothetical protein [Verrucomicrobiae bacterium]